MTKETFDKAYRLNRYIERLKTVSNIIEAATLSEIIAQLEMLIHDGNFFKGDQIDFLIELKQSLKKLINDQLTEFQNEFNELKDDESRPTVLGDS